MQYDEHLKKQLRACSPPEAIKVVLIGDVEGQSTRRYPADGFFNFWEDFNLDVPNGLYLLGYFTGNGSTLKTSGPKYLRVQRPTDQARLAEGSNPSHGLAAPIDSSRTVIFPEHQRELSAVEANLRAATAEFQKHKMAVSMQRDALSLARRARHTQELQEGAALNTTYRLEMQAMAETHSNITRRHVEHSAKMIEVLGLTSEMVGGVVSNLQKAASSIAQPPPPRVDYSETIVKSIGMLGGLALQMVSVIKGGPAAKIEPTPPPEDSVEAGLADKAQAAKAPNPRVTKPEQTPPSVGTAIVTSAPPETAPQEAATSAPAVKLQVDRADRPQTDRADKPQTDRGDKPQIARSDKPQIARSDMGQFGRDGVRESAAPPEAKPTPVHRNAAQLEPIPNDPRIAAEIEGLVTDFAEGSDQGERALPVVEPQANPSGVEFFLTPENESEHDRLVALLNKFRHRAELEQIIALAAPHLLKKEP